MALLNRTLAGGGANPDVVVQVDNNGAGVDIPVYRPRRRGFGEYDSGSFAVTNGAPTAVTALTIHPECGTLCNTGAERALVTWTDTAGNVLGMKTVEPQDTIQWPLPGAAAAFVGLKVGADKASVRAHISGAQA